MHGPVKELWARFDPALKMFPTQWLENFKKEFIDSYPKTSGYRAIRRFGLILLLLLVVPLWGTFLCARRCLCVKKS